MVTVTSVLLHVTDCNQICTDHNIPLHIQPPPITGMHDLKEN